MFSFQAASTSSTWQAFEMDHLYELAVREAMFSHLDRLLASSSDGTLRHDETASFEFGGERIVMRQTQGRGIHKPSNLSVALSITTAYRTSDATRPYLDTMGEDGYQRYMYEGSDPALYTNRALRDAMQLRLPLAYFIGVAKGVYKPIYPIYIIGDNPGSLEFTLGFSAAEVGINLADLSAPDRVYAARTTKQRLHQPVFRGQVLAAYATSCAVCRLKHAELLDAAHIISDAEPDGLPVVPNGIAMCKIHHAAYDRNFLGISPDRVIKINEDLLNEVDGPMLKYGLQAMHDQKLIVPSARRLQPDRERLERRFDEFLAAAS